MNIHEILVEIEGAYPEDIFPDTTEDERGYIKARHIGFIDRTSAMMGRHLVKVIREKLSQPIDDDEEMTDDERADRLEAMVDRLAEKNVDLQAELHEYKNLYDNAARLLNSANHKLSQIKDICTPSI